MQCLVREFYAMDIGFPTFSWFERIPSASNIAESPFRQKPEEACDILNVPSWEVIEVPDRLIEGILAQRLVE